LLRESFASDTFAGMRRADAAGFVVMQLLGAAAATFVLRWLVPACPKEVAAAVSPISQPIAKP